MEKFSLFSDMQIRGVMKGAQILLGFSVITNVIWACCDISLFGVSLLQISI